MFLVVPHLLPRRTSYLVPPLPLIVHHINKPSSRRLLPTVLCRVSEFRSLRLTVAYILLPLFHPFCHAGLRVTVLADLSYSLACRPADFVQRRCPAYSTVYGEWMEEK